MPPRESQSLEQLLRGSRRHATRHALWLTELRHDDGVFAEASILCPGDRNEWQAASYLLTGSHAVWDAFGDQVRADKSLGPVIAELNDPTRPWSTSEQVVLQWAAHLWNTGHSDVKFPHAFDQPTFRRWIIACHLRRGLVPDPTFTGGEQ